MPKFWTVQSRLYRRRPSPMFAIRSLSEDAAKINISGNALEKDVYYGCCVLSPQFTTTL